MKRISTFLAALLCTATAIFADLPFRNHRYDSFKVLDVTSDNIVFIGNSITDMHCWPEAFVTSNGDYLPIVNRGNSGTYSTEQSDNLESYINGKPKKVFMMIGTNDIATSGGLNFSPEQVLAYVKSIVARIHARSPQTKVYLYSILKNKTGNRVEATWLKANELTKAYADATDKVTYIDLYDKLAGVADGGAWSYDNLHLTAGAYQAWGKAICEYLAEGETYTVSCVYPEETLTLQNRGGLGNASHGMRATYFSCLPIKSDDVLVFGDSFVKNGEWQELLGNRNVKNRGTGWGNSGEIATTSGIVDATFATIDGVEKTVPKAMFLYTGTADACGSTDIATVKTNYKALVDKLTEKAPNAKIYLMAVCPRNNASHNTRIAELNAYMESLVSDNIRFVDTYTPMLNGEAVNSKYVFSNDYIGGLAYAKIANLMKEALVKDFPSDTYNVTSDAEAEVRYAQAGLRNQLTQQITRGLLVERGTGVGQYQEAACAALDAKLAASTAVLEKENITESDITTFTNELTATINALLPDINMPTYSTQGNEVWYQLNTPNRGKKYLSNFVVGEGVTGEAGNNYPSSMWKFVLRSSNDDKIVVDIINRKTQAYLDPSAAGSTQLKTSETAPAKGWTLSYSDAPGLFIVSSDGGVQLHQTNDAAVWNWGSGANRSDAGCQYMVSLVAGEADAEPTVPTDANFNNVVKKLTDLVDGWYKMRVVTGSDATMQGYITNGTNNILNANTPYKQSTSNFYPFKIGAYNTDKPATGWVKVKKIGDKYQIQSIGGFAVQEPCTATRDLAQGYTSLSMTYGGFTSVDKWSYYNPGANTEQPYIGKASSSSHKYAFAPVSATELAAYDIYTVTIDAENAAELGSDPSITYTGTANIGGIAKVYNNGYMFFPKGTVPVAADFTLPEGLQMKVNASAKTLTVAAEVYETLTLTSTQFANGQSTYTKHTQSSDGWYGKLVTGTTPALTIESTDDKANNIGWSSNQPWLQPGYTYNLTLPEGFVFVGYELTTKSVLGFTGTYTYTTATGTATSEAQSSDEKTVAANGLNTQAITLTVGDAINTGNGILITKLVIKYKEPLEEGCYSLEIKESTGSFTTGTKIWTMATNASNPVALTFTSNANNMGVNGGYLQIHPGTAGSATYTIAVPSSYVITGYSFDYAFGSTGTNAKTITVGDQQYAVAAEKKNLAVTDLNTQSTGFTLSGSNQPVKLTNFIVTVVEKEIELPDEIEYTLDKTNGDLYRDGAVDNSNYASAWKSKIEPQIAFGTGKNNMNWSNNNIQLMTGGGACTYTLTAPTGYMIEEYSFTFANNNHEVAHSLTMDNGMIYSTSKTQQTISNKNVQTPTVSFVLNGENGKGVVLTDFTVKVVKDVAAAPKVSTADNVYWYYITNASTKDYCAGKVIYYDADMQKLRFGDKAFMADRIWSFWEQNGKLAIKNYKGEYFGTAPAGTGGSTAFGVVSEPNYIYNVNEAHGFFVIKDDKVELHAQSDNKVIVRWGAEAGGASLWRFNAVDVTNADATVGSTYVQQGKVTTGIGNVDQPILRSTIRVSGLEGSVNFQGVKGRFEGTNAADVTNVKAFFASNDRELFIDAAKKMTWREENGVQYGEAVTLAQDGTFTITGSKEMLPGDYYLWITYDIAETAKEGNLVDAVITGYTVDGKEVAENNGNPRHRVTVFLSEGTVLMPMDKGSLHYRIPAITAVTKNGNPRLVVLTDDRKQSQSDLPNHCYVVAQYSDDLGKTWSDPLTVAGTAETGGDYGHGDASIVTDRNTGNIIGIMTSCAEYGHGFFAGTAEEPPLWKTIISEDGGETWSVPKNHTHSLFGAACDNEKTKTWKSGFSGSGAALQKRDGTIVSSFVNREADDSQNFYFFMSKDGGENWYVSGTSGTTAADEPKTLERNNGDLAISVRAGGYNYYNYTSDNGQTWYNEPQTRFNTGISGNACDGEYMVWCSTLEGNPWDITLQTIPNSGSRENVSIALSTDEGATFGTPKTICPSGSAYSATVVLPDGTLGVYYEENGVSGSPFVMRFVRFSLDWASNGEYKFTEETPFKPIKSVEPAAVTSTISEHKIGTFYANDPVNIPEGVKAYAAIEEPTMENGEGVLKMTEIEDIIPAHTGVVIRAEKGDYSFTQASTNGTVVNGNMLVGYAGPAEYKEVSLAEGYTTYVLTNKLSENEEVSVGFYKKEAGFKVYNNKAYLQVPATLSAQSISLRFGDEGTTEIETSTLNPQPSTEVYDLMGRRVLNPTKGMYIVNGRKVVIK